MFIFSPQPRKPRHRKNHHHEKQSKAQQQQGQWHESTKGLNDKNHPNFSPPGSLTVKASEKWMGGRGSFSFWGPIYFQWRTVKLLGFIVFLGKISLPSEPHQLKNMQILLLCLVMLRAEMHLVGSVISRVVLFHGYPVHNTAQIA